MDRMSDAYYVNSLLNNSYSDPYWTDYYNRYGFLDSYEPNMPCNNYGDEFYWDDPLLSSSPGLSGYSTYDRYDPYGSAAGLDDFSRMGDRGLGSPYNSLDPFDSYGGYASMSGELLLRSLPEEGMLIASSRLLHQWWDGVWVPLRAGLWQLWS